MKLPDWLASPAVRRLVASLVADPDDARIRVLADAIEDAGYVDPGAYATEWEGVARCLRSDDPAVARRELARLLRGYAGELDPDYYRHPTTPYTPGTNHDHRHPARNVVDDELEELLPDEDEVDMDSFRRGPQAFNRMVQNSWGGWHDEQRQHTAEEIERLFATLTQGTFDLGVPQGYIEQTMPQARGWAANPLFDPQLQPATPERALGVGRLAPGLMPGDVLLVDAAGRPLATPDAHLFHMPADPVPEPFRPATRQFLQFPARRRHGFVVGRPG